MSSDKTKQKNPLSCKQQQRNGPLSGQGELRADTPAAPTQQAGSPPTRQHWALKTHVKTTTVGKNYKPYFTNEEISKLLGWEKAPLWIPF